MPPLNAQSALNTQSWRDSLAMSARWGIEFGICVSKGESIFLRGDKSNLAYLAGVSYIKPFFLLVLSINIFSQQFLHPKLLCTFHWFKLTLDSSVFISSFILRFKIQRVDLASLWWNTPSILKNALFEVNRSILLFRFIIWLPLFI